VCSLLPLLTAFPGNGKLRRILERLPPFPLEDLGLDPDRFTQLPKPAAAGVAAAGAVVAPGPLPATPYLIRASTPELWRAYLLLSFLAHVSALGA
jgi:hypothetical protein